MMCYTRHSSEANDGFRKGESNHEALVLEVGREPVREGRVSRGGRNALLPRPRDRRGTVRGRGPRRDDSDRRPPRLLAALWPTGHKAAWTLHAALKIEQILIPSITVISAIANITVI